MDVKIEKSWKKVLDDEFRKEYFLKLAEFVKEEYKGKPVYPKPKEIFRAFEMSSFLATRAVILGQDPYHGAGQANGLCFSVNEGVAIPPSLINIYKEIERDTGKTMPKSGNLERWAREGVLLLNATLTVRAKSPGSHQKKGWEEFTDSVIETLNIEKENVVFMLWGAYAQRKGEKIDRKRHLVLEAAHPSPFSADRGFFGCRHFSKTNAYLIMHGMRPINW